MATRISQTEAGGTQAPMAPATLESNLSGAVALSSLLDALIEQAPRLVQSRSLLPAFDWRNATPEQAERLLARLAECNMRIPAWLAKGLLTAGHRVPAVTMAGTSPGLEILAHLSSGESRHDVEALSRQLLDIARHENMEDWVASTLVARLVSLGETALACRIAWCQFQNAPEAMRLIRRYESAELERLPPLRLRLAGSATTHDLASALKPAFAAAGWRVEVSEAAFGSIISELLKPAEGTDALVLLLTREVIGGNDWRTSPADARRIIDDELEALIGAMSSFCAATQVPLLVNTLPAPSQPSAGHIDGRHATGECAIVAEINRRLIELAASCPSMHLIDANQALSRFAADVRRDQKLWYFGRIPYTESATRWLATAHARVWLSLRRGCAKVLAVDFDNTLWGGVYGDDGIDRLQCGDDFPGNAFKAFQQECLRLKSQGMVLIGLSKNNPDAADVFRRHPGMALREDDFVAKAINWDPKPDNIKRIAADLGLGLESIVFLDDSPHEREVMRRMCPDVIVPEMPADPSHRPVWLRSLACTWPLRLTEEDTRRSDMYAAERQGRELREKSQSYDEYLSKLQQKLVISPVGPGTLARAAQLHQRTNQFNLTGMRLGEAELSDLASDPQTGTALIGRVSDRFGDYGIVLSATAKIEAERATILSFVMSCRTIGRQLEAAFLEALLRHLACLGVREAEGRYIQTSKNGLVSAFYATQGFTEAGCVGDAVVWRLSLSQDAIAVPRPVAVEWEMT